MKENQVRELLQSILNESLDKITASGSRDKERALKMTIRPVKIKETLLFQEALYRGAQVYHSNLRADQVAERLTAYMGEALFSQIQIEGEACRGSILVGKKGNITVKLKQAQEGEGKAKTFAHNREKQYILSQDKPLPFLVRLGVQHPEGGIVKARYDKFRQINRYLEFIQDVLPALAGEEELHIIDFGCGKSYLTFAMYYYLHELKGMNVRITGLDLKKDVISECRALAEECGYDRLEFRLGDISRYESTEQIHMVVSLHACDTATDYALEKAVKWGARVILAVPCCQHELNRQIHNKTMEPVLKYGIIKERMAALLTDALRANLLEQQGYDTQILEFIDMEHTPKNLLIRAVRTGKMRGRMSGQLKEAMEWWNVSPTLKDLLESD